MAGTATPDCSDQDEADSVPELYTGRGAKEKSMSHAGNVLAIVTAAVAAWLFGGIYYTALSGPWLKAMGKTMEQCKAEQAAKVGIAKAAPFILVFVGELIMAWATYGILLHMYMFTLRGRMISAAACWVRL